MFLWTQASMQWMADAAAKSDFYRILAQRVVDGLFPGATVFEGGCGLGFLSAEMARLGLQVTAMDIDPQVVAFAGRAKVPVTFQCGDAFFHPPSGPFDGAVFCRAGSSEELLRVWESGICQKMFVVHQLESMHRFSMKKKPQCPSTHQLAQLLQAQRIPFSHEELEADFGQPLASLDEAIAFVRYYSNGAPVDPQLVENRLESTGDIAFPYKLPAVRRLGMFIIGDK